MSLPPPKSTLFPYTTLFRSLSLLVALVLHLLQLIQSNLQTGAQILQVLQLDGGVQPERADRKSTRLNSSHITISYAVFCLKKKNKSYISRTHLYTPQCTPML